MVQTLANIADNVKPGEVYNIGGDEFHDIETASDIILDYLGKSDKDLVTYKESEILTTKVKLVDCLKARRDLHHQSTVSLEDGIKNTIDWMRVVYGIDDVIKIEQPAAEMVS